MFTCTPLSDVEYYIDAVNEDLTAQSVLTGEGERPARAPRKRGDWSGRDRAAYYLDNGTGEKPGIWWTTVCKLPGQSLPFVEQKAEVSPSDFRALARGCDPLTGQALVQSKGQRRVGYDLQFAAPKSVSVLWAMGTESQRNRIEAAQEQAVFAALEYAFTTGLIVTRRGHNGGQRETPAELMAGTFLHTTSRAGDPQIHTHAVLMNVCRRKDGSTGTLDNRELLLHQQEMGAVYRLALSEALERDLGLTTLKDGRNFRVAGVAPSVEERFSKRRAAIEQEARHRGIQTAHHREAAEHISRNTRGAKSDLPSRTILRTRWEQEVREEGWTPEALWECALAATGLEEVPSQDPQTVFACALEELTQTDAVFEDRHLIGTVLEHCQGRRLTLAQALEEAHAARRSEHLIEVTGNALSQTRNLHYATPEVINAERALVRLVTTRRDERVFVSRDRLEGVLAKRETLSEEQADLVRHALNRDGVSVVEGSAGTGKSYSLGTAAAVAREAGCRVWVTAPSHQAVSVIAQDTQTPPAQAAVLRSFLNRLKDPDHAQAITLARHDVVILDEGGMVGTMEMAELLEVTSKAGAKVIVAGDTRQLKPVAPGSPMRLLAETLGTQRLEAIRRQKEMWQRQASQALAAGQVEQAVRSYDAHGRLIVGEGEALQQTLVDAVCQDVSENPNDTRLVLARTHAEVKALNQALRSVLISKGDHAGACEITVEATVRGRKPVVEALPLVAGDRLIFGETLKAGAHLVRNNDLATVKAVYRDPDGEPVLCLVFDRGFEVTTRWADLIPVGRHSKGHKEERPIKVQHAYAVTLHSAQGASVDRAFVLNRAGLDRELLYVAMTRHRQGCTLYTDTTRMALLYQKNQIRRDGVVVDIDGVGRLEAPDALDQEDEQTQTLTPEMAIRQIILEGQQSSGKQNAADFVVNRQAWAEARSAEEAVAHEIRTRTIASEAVFAQPRQDPSFLPQISRSFAKQRSDGVSHRVSAQDQRQEEVWKKEAIKETRPQGPRHEPEW